MVPGDFFLLHRVDAVIRQQRAQAPELSAGAERRSLPGCASRPYPVLPDAA
jgi:hypothetical protein